MRRHRRVGVRPPTARDLPNRPALPLGHNTCACRCFFSVTRRSCPTSTALRGNDRALPSPYAREGDAPSSPRRLGELHLSRTAPNTLSCQRPTPPREVRAFSACRLHLAQKNGWPTIHSIADHPPSKTISGRSISFLRPALWHTRSP